MFVCQIKIVVASVILNKTL